MFREELIRSVKRTLRKLRPAAEKQPDWRGLLGKDFARWQNAVNAGSKGPAVLLATSIGIPANATLDSLLAVALTLRGAKVHVLLCDKVLPSCEQCTIGSLGEKEFLLHGPKRDICPRCFPQSWKMFRSLGVEVHRYSDFLSPEDFEKADSISESLSINDLDQYELEGVPIGEHVLAGALRFYARGTFEGEDKAHAVLKRYVQGALLTASVVSRLLKRHRFDCASFHNGIYVPQGVIGAVAKARGVRLVNWFVAYRKRTFLFSHGDTYHHTLMTEQVSNWEKMRWTPEKESELLDYLRSRWGGSNDWISFSRIPEENAAGIHTEIKLDWSRPSIGLLTNVVWDAQLHYPANAFPNMLEWLFDTVRYFARRPDLNLVIRVHPAETRGHIPSRQRVVEELRREFPKPPKNISIVPPESSINTYALMSKCDSVLIYGTKTGVELTSMGIPVIVAGEAWIRNKGMTLDASSRGEYMTLLDQLPLKKRLSEEEMQRSRKYAYHFFFRRMIPIKCVVPNEGFPVYRIELQGLDDLMPGSDTGLDIICDGILHEKEFIYPAEETSDSVGKPEWYAGFHLDSNLSNP